MRRIGVKSAEIVINKRHPSHSIVNAIGGKYPRAPKRPNKSKIYNGNAFKDRDNKTKKLALLGKRPNK